MSTDNRGERERRRAIIVWEALERASDHLTPGHPAELDIRRALAAAENYWRSLPEAHTVEAHGVAIRQEPS